jgi:hypothetical protein
MYIYVCMYVCMYVCVCMCMYCLWLIFLYTYNNSHSGSLQEDSIIEISSSPELSPAPAAAAAAAPAPASAPAPADVSNTTPTSGQGWCDSARASLLPQEPWPTPTSPLIYRVATPTREMSTQTSDILPPQSQKVFWSTLEWLERNEVKLFLECFFFLLFC